MPYSWRDRLGMWLQRFTVLDRVLLRYDGIAPDGRRRYVNRINRFSVLRDGER